MEDPRYVANPANRCYFCKAELWSVLERVRAERGIAMIVDGTNADDLSDHRPGRTAASEHDVRSPLAELGFTKAEIRERSRAARHPHLVAALVAVPVVATAVRHARHDDAARRGGARRARAADARRRRQSPRAAPRRARAGREWISRSSTAGSIALRAATLRDAVRAAGFARVSVDLRGFRSGSLNIRSAVATELELIDPVDSASLSRT